MAIDFSNIAGNIRDREGNRPTRPTQQQQNVYQQAAQSMADAGIRSLSGRTKDDREGVFPEIELSGADDRNFSFSLSMACGAPHILEILLIRPLFCFVGA